MAKPVAKYWQVLPVLVILGIAFYLPHLWDSPYYMHLMVLLWIYAVLAISVNLFMGFLGGFSLGYTAFFGLGGYTTGLVTTKLDWPTGVGLLVAMGVCAVGSMVLGIAALRLRGVYFLLLTIASLGIVAGLSNTLYNLTGGSSGLRDIPPVAVGVGDSSWNFKTTNYFYYLALCFVIVCYLLTYCLINSRVGRGFVAVRDNEELANAIGINPFKYRMIGFVISSTMAGVAGWLYAHYVHILDPTVFGFNILFDILFMVILGGIGTLPGPVIGAFIVVFIPEFLRMAEAWRMATIAGFMLVMMIFMPYGLYGFIKIRWMRIQYYMAMRKAQAAAGPSAAVPVEQKGFLNQVKNVIRLLFGAGSIPTG